MATIISESSIFLTIWLSKSRYEEISWINHFIPQTVILNPES